MAHASHMILFPPKINGCIDGVGSGVQKKKYNELYHAKFSIVASNKIW